jgi:nucleotide-binding universal stress UspA family protein
VDIHSILAVTDFSPHGDRAVLRAATLARQQRRLLKLMYAPSDLRGTVEADAARGVKRFASELHERFDILVKNVADTSGHLEAVAEEARWVDLLVIGPCPEGSTLASFCRQPVERLQRSITCPILVARQDPIHRYGRILVANDATPREGKLLQVARALERDAEIEQIHALDAKLDSEWRDRVVPRSDSIAELIVLGAHRRCGISDFLFGSVASRVLRRSTGDVLLVPHDLRIEPTPGPVVTAEAPRMALRPRTQRG